MSGYVCTGSAACTLEELVVEDEEDEQHEADDDAYGNQFLLFGPIAQQAVSTVPMHVRRGKHLPSDHLGQRL